MSSAIWGGFLGRYLSQLRYPWLVALAATLFVLDLFIPDFVPFVDELMLAVITVLLASRTEHRSEPETTTGSGDSRSVPKQ